MLRARYRRIVFFFGRVLFGIGFWDLLLPRLGLRNWALRTRPNRLRRIAIQYRSMAIQMGGVLIKVGQFLSARVDVLPREITVELAGLQDEVPAEDFEDIRRVAEAELGMPLSEKFYQFEAAPLAAASLGQAHRARLRVRGPAAGDEEAVEMLDVVVKVQRPNIQHVIATDLAALRTVGAWLRRYPPIRKRANVPALLDEFTRTLYEEVDYLAEGRNAETFAANFENQADVLVPRIIWTHTTLRVLTLEDVGGIKITDYAAIREAGIDRTAVANRLLDTYLKQIFEDGFSC
jgi:predicted unusual protein kinase regulating ubiquinone biosynthesis (AarF/ABC1/UbiB family)